MENFELDDFIWGRVVNTYASNEDSLFDEMDTDYLKSCKCEQCKGALSK